MRVFVCVLALAVSWPAPVGAEVLDPADLRCRYGLTVSGCMRYFRDADGDGHGDPARSRLTDGGISPGWSIHGDDCDDADATRHPGGFERFDGDDEDCDDAVDELAPTLSELMIDPRAVADTAGEWIEVADASGGGFDLAGVTISVGTRTCELSGRAPSGLGVVTGRSQDPETNGGVAVWSVCAFSLVNSGFTAVLRAPDGRVLDTVTTSGWTVPIGASLGAGVIDAAANDDGSVWCAQTTPRFEGGDAMTPGVPNDAC